MLHSSVFSRTVLARASIAALVASCVVIASSGVSSSATSSLSLTGPTGSEAFGLRTLVLSNGNYVVTDPLFDDPTHVDVGAVHLYNGANNQLISTLTGSHDNDRVGGSVLEVGAGNFVVRSPDWNFNVSGGNGAVTWVNGTTGLNGIISPSNSLVGSKSTDHIGSHSVTVLTNGNYVVDSPNWADGLVSGQGAVTWGSGAIGVSGAVSSGNSLVGNTTDDQIGSDGVTALTNGNYVVDSTQWTNGTALRAGAVTWGNGAGGTNGVVSSGNSLVGTVLNDSVGSTTDALNGSRAITPLSNGNYVVVSADWSNGAVTQVGAVTLGNGATGTVGAVSQTNSLVGASVSDFVGLGGITALSNSNYVVISPVWDNGAANEDAGAITWTSGSITTTGLVTSANSLVGSHPQDRIGTQGSGATPHVVALSNGNYVVASPQWDNGSTVDAGAATWANGATGAPHGALTVSNSLVGTTTNDQVGLTGATALTTGNYVVGSPLWNSAGVLDAGAATWGNGTSGTTGVVGTANSLVGDAGGDRVGAATTALTNGNYVVASQTWRNSGVLDAGAATWGNGATGTIAVVSPANSLVGTKQSDQVGVGAVTPLLNGNYVVHSFFWNNGVTTQAGAATWRDGSVSSNGAVGPANSLVGTTAFDHVGVAVTPLTDGNYVVGSPAWDDGSILDVGAATWADGTTGIAGSISASNSLVAAVSASVSDPVVTAFPGGNYVVISRGFQKGGFSVGAVTFGPVGGLHGLISEANSAIGKAPGSVESVSSRFTTDNALVVSTSQNQVLLLRVGPQSPTFTTVPANVAVTTPPGAPSAIVNYAVPAATAQHGTPSVVCNPPSGSLFSIGMTTVTCTATDSERYTATTSFTVTVIASVGGDPPPTPPVEPDYTPLTPARLADTRPGETTIDGAFAGQGIRPAGSTLELVVAGRGGVAAGAVAASLNVTVAESANAGFVTVYPCGAARPTASSLNYIAGAIVPNAVIPKIGAGGMVCVFTSATAQIIVDVNGYFPAGSVLHTINPARLLDTRPGELTIDGSQQGQGLRAGRSTTAVQITGRASVPADATAAVLNITVTDAEAPGFVTVYPCGAAQPTASNINYGVGSTIANLVIAKMGAGGTVCIFTQSPVHLIADVGGYFPPGSSFHPLDPARLLDTRPFEQTFDGQFLGAGTRSTGTTTELVVNHRGGVDVLGAATVVLNVTVTGAIAPGFITVYPCGIGRPFASNLNYQTGATVANAAIVSIGIDGKVCLFNSGATDLVVDVNGFFPA